jgi:hypothetical protein
MRRSRTSGLVRRVSIVLALAAVAVSAATASAKHAKHARHPPTTITMLSARADLVAGGQALVQIELGTPPLGWVPTVTLNQRDVTREFLATGSRMRGLVTGLRLGANLLAVRLPDGSGARLTIADHPTGGPLFSGPQVQPWACEAGALDRQCDKPPQYSYLYRSTSLLKSGFQPYDPAHPPSDVATTRTEQGQTMPFVVRVETGYVDRDQYKIAALYRPGQGWTWSRPQPQFNHKLLITHGASCNVDYATGSSPSVTAYNPVDLLGLPVKVPAALNPVGDAAVYALGRGFAVMSTALDNTGHNCDVVTQAESLVMAKQHVIESYGTLRYTIGIGCSGGSLAQQWIANAYPGIYQGILPTCSFPDTWSSATQVMDYHLLRAYFERLPTTLRELWTPLQWADVEGNLLPLDAIVSDIGFFSAIVPTHACGGVSPAERYQPQANPGGVRCSISDLALNVFGPRSPAVWSANEKKLGHGFAGVAVDNVGVQYGLDALNAGQITPAQFVDLNARIGGLGIDITPTASRISADRPALANAYRSGMINETNNLDQTAIIDCRGPDPGAAHDSYRAFAVRARLDREHGTHANQAIWEGPVPIIGDLQCLQQSFVAMDGWLAAVAGDHSSRSLASRIIDDRPSNIRDQCLLGVGIRIATGLCPAAIVPVYGTPRTVAGDAITTDANKCRLQPLARGDYRVDLSDGQWAQLQATFPTGVCDFGRPGVDQQPTIPWLTYQTAAGKVIFGGRPLGPPPRSRPFGQALLSPPPRCPCLPRSARN